MSPRIVIISILVIIAGFLALDSVFVVTERNQAIVVQFGEPKRTETESGLHFKLPFFEQVIKLDKRTLSLDIRPQEVITSDELRILVDSFARFRIVKPLVTYQAATTELQAADRLEKIVQSAVRQVLAQEVMATTVSGDRAALMRQISDITNERASALGLDVIDVRLKRVDLPAENSQSIFQRMETERQQEAAEQRALGEQSALEIRANADREVVVIKAEAEQEAQILRGEADAKAAKIFADAFNQDQEFFEFYRTMQAYRKALDSRDTSLVLSPDSEFFKLFVQDGGGK